MVKEIESERKNSQHRHFHVPEKKSIAEFLYDPKTKAICGRNKESWRKCLFCLTIL